MTPVPDQYCAAPPLKAGTAFSAELGKMRLPGKGGRVKKFFKFSTKYLDKLQVICYIITRKDESNVLRSVPAPEVGVQGQSVKRPISKSELETGEAQKVEIKK